jgi:hypothetical protein
VIDLRVIDTSGDPNSAGAAVLRAAADSAAVIYAGPGTVLTSIRPKLEPTHVPVFLLDGDLYTTRGLYSNVFQASVPLLWQARVIAHYFRVRGDEMIMPFYFTPEAKPAWISAAAEEHLQTDEEPPIKDGEKLVGLGPQPGMMLGGAAGAPTQWATSDSGLRARQIPGDVAVAGYAWAGWAEPLPRVHDFRQAFRAAYGRLPFGNEQHGFDTVKLLASSLIDTKLKGGARLIAQLETVKNRFFSYMAIRLNPDDHVFYDDWTLGLFAVAGPDETLEPWMSEGTPWRPVMRTFTNDDKRTTVWERDRKPFFPGWNDPEPSPPFWWSRIGIITRAGDPLH